MTGPAGVPVVFRAEEARRAEQGLVAIRQLQMSSPTVLEITLKPELATLSHVL